MELLVGGVKDKVSLPSLAFTLHSRHLNVFPHRWQFLVDDMTDTGTVLTLAAWSLNENGASPWSLTVGPSIPFPPSADAVVGLSEASMSVTENVLTRLVNLT